MVSILLVSFSFVMRFSVGSYGGGLLQKAPTQFIVVVVRGLVLLLLLIANGSAVQAQAYVRAAVGPGIGVSRDAFGLPALRRDANNVVVEQRTLFGTFGNGFRASLAGGYWFTPYFGAELNAYYFVGFEQAYGSSISDNGNRYERVGSSYQVRLAPSVVVQAPEGKWRPFGRFGVVLPVWGRLTLEESWYYAADDSRRDKQTAVEGKFSLGFESTFGVAYTISERVSVSAQVTYTGLRIRGARATAIQNDLTASDGTVTNTLENARTIFREIEFQDVLTPESNTSSLLGGFFEEVPNDILIEIDGTLDFDRPLNLPTQSTNANSLFFEVGVQYVFLKKAE